MFTKQKTTDADLQAVADIIKLKLLDDSVDAAEFIKLLDQYTKLIMLQTSERKSHRVSPDVLAGIVANLVGIGIIVKHEQVNVIATKALAFVAKLR